MAKTYNTISTFTSGQVLTAAQMNEIGTNVNNYRVPPSCRLVRSGDLTYTSNAAIAWNSEAYDTDTMHDNSTNNSRITINTAGIYLFSFAFLATFSGTLTAMDVQIFKGNASAWLSYQTVILSKGTDVLWTTSTVASMAVSDFVVAQVSFAGATSPIIKADDRTSFSATWLGQSS
jgi:hypothetical protein